METKPFYNDVNEWLTVGCDLDLAQAWLGQTHAETIAILSDHGVTHVLDARIEHNDAHVWNAAGMSYDNYAHAPITDDWNHEPSEVWYQNVEAFVRRFLLERDHGDRMYVHCHMGVNRGPSAAMLALLTYNPFMSPWEAFLAIREARPIAGLVYAEHVGARHILNRGLDTGADKDKVCAEMGDFRALLSCYWTPELSQAVNKGVRYFHDTERGTLILSD